MCRLSLRESSAAFAERKATLSLKTKLAHFRMRNPVSPCDAARAPRHLTVYRAEGIGPREDKRLRGERNYVDCRCHRYDLGRRESAVQASLQQALEQVITYGPKLVAALVVVVLGYVVARLVGKLSSK